jgi:hypothetical protein
MVSRALAFSSFFWTFSEAILLRGISFIALIILARVLGPNIMGTFGIIAVFIAIGNSIVESGFSSSIIRSSSIDNLDLSSIFFTNIVASISLYFLMFFLAPILAQYYHQGTLVNLIRVYCLVFIISALSTVHLAKLEREMRFKRLLIFNLPGNVIGAILGILMAINDMGIWSIVYMYLCIQSIQTLILWIFSGWHPLFIFSFEKMKKHFSFGYKLMLSGILDTVFKNLNNLIIGRYFSLKDLGFYDRAKTLNEYPVTIFTGIINKVSYPLLSQIQNERERLSEIYKLLIQVSFFILTPLIIISAAIAKPIFIFILGENWLNSVPFFKILCFASIFYPIHTLNITILKVYGKSDIFLKLELIKKIATILIIFCLFQFGIYGLVWSSFISSVFALLVNTYYSKPLINYSTKSQLYDIIPTLVSSLFIYVVVSVIYSSILTSPIFVQILFPTFVGIFLYILIHHLIDSNSLKMAKKFIALKK